MRRLHLGAWALMLAVVAAAGIVVLKCEKAQAQDIPWVPEIKPYGGPTFIATAYSDNDKAQDPADSPHVRARVGFSTPITRKYQVVGPILWRPEVAFVWRAQRWPIGAESSPITESIYQPEAFVALAPGSDIMLGPFEFEGGRIGWTHQSNGTDSLSASWDRVTFEGTVAYGDWLRVSARGWYVLDTGMDTSGIVNYANFGAWQNAGGELYVEAFFDFAKFRGTLGLTSQDVEAAIPFADFWAASLILWFHNGEMGSLVDYATAETIGGAGVGFFY